MKISKNASNFLKHRTLVVFAILILSLIPLIVAPISPRVQSQSEQVNGHTKRYKWHQSKELLSIIYDNSIVTEDQVSCAFSHDSICLKIDQSDVIVEGKLEKEILVQPSRWFLQDGR